jgi:hypothetical protein
LYEKTVFSNVTPSISLSGAPQAVKGTATKLSTSMKIAIFFKKSFIIFTYKLDFYISFSKKQGQALLFIIRL